MATTMEDLERRVHAIEDELRSLKREVSRPVSDRAPMDGTILEWYAELRRRNREGGTLQERRRRLGIPVDMPRVGARRLQEMLLAEGIRPEERLLSSEIIRLREDERP